MNEENKKDSKPVESQKQPSTPLEDIRESLDAKLTEFRAKLDAKFDSSWQNILPKSYKDALLPRNAVPFSVLDEVSPLPEENLRYVGDNQPTLTFSHRANVLTLSGGGANGAYGAGLLAGWSQRGSRPDFDVVMGVSTGSIIGLFAFLGMAYDDTLRHFYNEYTTEDLVTRQMLHGLTLGASMYDNSKLADLLAYYIDDVAVHHLANAHTQGRKLLIGTTNLDRALPVTWDVTAIASTKSIHATALIRDIVLASCAIPVAFPPVMIPVFDTDGNKFDEMHVDGGASRQMLIDIPNSATNVYAIVNNRLSRPYQPVDVSALDIANKSLSSLITGSVTGDLYRLHARTRANGSGYHATWIDDIFAMTLKEMFDQTYMRKLYEFGFQAGVTGKEWHTMPPE